ncbi:MAG: transglycosylase domain-containing protein [Nevskiales bacterium]|nr:transglycosylase domain-containing protein [Nevskiales bacterium]
MSGRGPLLRVTARRAATAIAAALVGLGLATLLAQRPLPQALVPQQSGPAQRVVLDRHGGVLNERFDGDWNRTRQRRLESVPLLLRRAVVAAEDRRFWRHHGPDWRARAAAAWQNLRAGRVVRGASTISEQVVRMLHPRPRTLWSRWVEGFEAARLERRFSKSRILEFYLDQVPYGGNRRGVAQAAEFYFGRSLETLSAHEMLALAVLVRAPSRLPQQPQRLAAAVGRLATTLTRPPDPVATSAAELTAIALDWRRQVPPARAPHFVAEVHRRAAALPTGGDTALRSSLDPQLQQRAEAFLRDRLQDLSGIDAHQAAALVVDLDGNRIRAWAVADADHQDVVGIDAVRVPRQPGSTLKPLLYAMALERGWTPETLIADTRLNEAVNTGLHEYRNYSRTHYGAVSLREALGNSLNIPAVRALGFVGGQAFLQRLRALGVSSLDAGAPVYGDGLALGNGELSLYELVQAYTALARAGRYQPLTVFADDREPRPEQALIAAAAARRIGDILSDPAARLLEFGDGGVLAFPLRTAVKTGTSSDYRDAWTVAYDGRYVVGVWVGNLSGRATSGVTGARGAALLVRSLLASLPADPQRVLAVAAPDGGAVGRDADAAPPWRDVPDQARLSQPFDGLRLARDPRIPDPLEAFEFELAWAGTPVQVRWIVDGQVVATTPTGAWAWPLQAGHHRAQAEVTAADGQRQRTPEVHFEVY